MTSRRGACPSLDQPMESGDGLLLRISPAEPAPIDEFENCVAAARTLGNGTIEVTSRGSLQFRGFTQASASQFASQMMRFRLVDDADRVITNPLRGEVSEVLDVTSVAACVRRAIREADLHLAPKVSVVLDGGGNLHLDELTADVRFRAVPISGGARLNVTLGGSAFDAFPLCSIPLELASELAVSILRELGSSGYSRMRAALDALGPSPFLRAAGSGVENIVPVASRSKAEPMGRHALREGLFAVGLGLFLGHADAERLLEMSRFCREQGAHWFRAAPGRTILFGSFPAEEAEASAEFAARLGFIVRGTDPRGRLTACAGAPACASGYLRTRVVAQELATPNLPAGEVHLSGCAKGCARRSAASITVVGTPDGAVVVFDGDVSKTPDLLLSPDALSAKLKELVGSRTEMLHA
jgi:precorrin-3B synthase